MSNVIQSILGWLGHGASIPLCHPSDTVLPLHSLDSSRLLRELIMQRTYRFNAVLDPDMLRDSWEGLLAIGDWRKLGGRLRLNTTTRRLELRIPTPFSEARPGVFFTQAAYNCAIDEHRVGAMLKPVRDKAWVSPITEEILKYLRGPETPDSFNEYLVRDVPIWSCHVIAFTDATLVTITYPHVMDGSAVLSILENWSRVLAGTPQDVLPLGDPYKDALSLVADSDPAQLEEALVPESKRLAGFRLFVWVVRQIAGKMLSSRPPFQFKALFIPLRYIPSMEEEGPVAASTAEAKAVSGQQFLGPTDIFMAWLIRAICKRETGSQSRSITLIAALNVRDRLPPGVAYLQNLCLLTSNFLTLGQVVAQPLRRLAIAVRESIRKQTSPAQVSGNAQQLLRTLATSGSIPLFGETDSLFINISNMAQVDMFQPIDCGPAVVSADYENMDPGRPVWHMGAATELGVHLNSMMITRQEEDYWVEGCMSGDVWADVEAQLQAWNRAGK